MSSVDAPTAAPAGELRELSGWGRTAPAQSAVVCAKTPEQVLAALDGAARSGSRVLARGAGCSYGDAAQNRDGLVVEMTALQSVLQIDAESGRVRAQAGITISGLMGALAAHELTVPVVPGTRHVTLAGAIASDIHGKNHHRDGAFARHVESIELWTPAGALAVVSAESDPELFYATLGGMGLTGVVLAATLRAAPLPSPWVSVDTDRTADLHETLAVLAGPETHRYSVAWMDMLSHGPGYGRAVIERADPLPAQDAPRGRGPRARRGAYPASVLRGPVLDVPARFPAGLLRPATVRAFNELNWRASPRRARGHAAPIAPYFFPLDVLGSWNRMYGPKGLVQYQFVIPAGQEKALEDTFELIRVRRLPVYLSVFKRFGPGFGGPLSFPIEGWTLAIDLPADAPGLRSALAELDALIASAGGRVYLTKDSRMDREALGEMYPRLHEFARVRERVDPSGVLSSDLGRRLGLCEASA